MIDQLAPGHWVREGSGPTILVVHGGPDFGSGYLRRHLPRALPASTRLVFFDLPGTGHAPRANGAPPTFETMVHAVRDVLASEDGAGCVLLGHSFGGLVALLAAADPDAGRIRRLVLVDPDPPTRAEWESVFGILEARRSADERERIRRIEAADTWRGDPAEAEHYIRLKLRAYCFEPERADEVDVDVPTERLAAFGAVGAQVRSAAGDWDFRARLAEVRVPALVVTGPASVYPVGSIERLTESLCAGRLVSLPGTGHFPFLESHVAFRSAVASFLEE